MAVLWLQSASLLVLLAALCPGTEGFSSQHLCGPHLVEALNMVCADRGFYYNPRRDVHPFMNLFPAQPGGSAAQGQNDVPLKEQMEMIVKRGIVEECCHNPCSLLELEKYCN